MIAEGRITTADDRAARAEATARAEEARTRTARARAERKMIRNATVAFTASSRSRLRRGTRVRGGSADSHRPRYTLQNLRRDCQQLFRNNELARGMVLRLSSFVVGGGFGLQLRTPDAAFNTAVERLWKRAAATRGRIDITGEHSVHGLARALVEALATDGSVGVLPIAGGFLQTIEAERFLNPDNRANDERFVNGAELSPAGRILRYHVGEWDYAGTTVTVRTRPIDAGAMRVLHSPLGQPAAGHWTEPPLACAIQRFEMIADWDEAVLANAMISACTALIVKTSSAAVYKTLLPGETVTGDDGESRREMTWEPGSIMMLEPDDDVQPITPAQPNEKYEPFILSQVMQAGMALGMPLPLTLLDMRLVNFHSGRMAVVLAWVGFARWIELVVEFYRMAFGHWLAERVRAGEITIPAGVDPGAILDAAEWQAPPKPVVDPKVEAEANKIFLESGQKTYREVLTERGVDWEEHFAQRSVEAGLLGAAPVNAKDAKGSEATDRDVNRDVKRDVNRDVNRDPAEQRDTEGAGGAGKKPAAAPSAREGGYLVGHITTAHTIAKDVTARALPADTGRAILTRMIGLDEGGAEDIIGPAIGFEPAAAPAGDIGGDRPAEEP